MTKKNIMGSKQKTLESVIKNLAQSFGFSRNNDKNSNEEDNSLNQDGYRGLYKIESSKLFGHKEIEIKESIPSRSTAYITIGQTINGSIVLSDDVIIEGTVNGDVDSSGNVVIRGKVNGNIKGDNIDINKADVSGDIEAQSNLNISNCKIIGNVTANTVEINGHIDGNIITKELCCISEEAVINGNISARLLVVKENSKINGQITMIN